ncbi:MAG: hypothetical protein C0507_21490 [Cyanobacteria bacterium PR.3.49]|nr:hypothetical protein [Cyanobacteria bacterium PR.3.49]
MARLICIFISLVLLSLSGIPAHSFAGKQKLEIFEVVPQEEAWTDSDYDNAEIALQAALLATNGDFNKQLPVLAGLADLYHERKKYKEEVTALLDLIKVMGCIDDYPAIPLAAQHLRLSTVYYELEDFRSAAKSAQTAVEIFRGSCGPDSPNLALAYNNLGWIEQKLGSLDAALEHFEKSLAIVNKNLGKKSLLYGLISENLAVLYTQKGEHEAAYFWYRSALKTLGDYLDKDDPLVSDLLNRCNQSRSLARSSSKRDLVLMKSKKKLAGESKPQK